MRKFTLVFCIVFISILSLSKMQAQVPGSSCANPIPATINDDCLSGTAISYPMDFSVAPPQGIISCNTGTVYGYWMQLTITETFSLSIHNNYDLYPIGIYVLAGDCTGQEIECSIMDGEFEAINIDPGVYYALFWTPTLEGSTTLCFEKVSCMEPQYIEANTITYYSANLNWDAPIEATEVEWEVTAHGEPTIIIDSGTTSDDYTEVVNLIDNNLYHFKIRSNCSDTEYSDWVDYAFSTPDNLCEEPYNLMLSDVTNSTVSFEWEYEADATAWDYDVRPTGNPAPAYDDIGNPVTEIPTTDGGLNADTTYDVYVRTHCDSGTSAWIGPVTFTTLSNEAADWNNLQWPPDGTIDINTPFTVYAQIYEPGLTNAENDDFGAGISAWIGFNDEDTDPSTWTNWSTASYNVDDGNNDEFKADIGSGIGVQGTYYYASRFKINNGYYTYGGLNGFWNGDSGVLTVENSLGIANQAIEGFRMYPNPVANNLTIHAKNRIESVAIINMLGQEIRSFNTDDTDLQLEVSSIPKGNYIIKILTGEQMGAYHFIKK